MHKAVRLLSAGLLLVAAGPAPRDYAIDSANSDVSAKVAFFAIASKTAHFPDIRGGAKVSPGAPDTMELDVTLDARALTAPDAVTLRRLKSEKFFWVDRYPTVRFRGRGLHMRDASHGWIDGRLTARGVTQPVRLSLAFAQPLTDIAERKAFNLTATTEIDRRDFGMTAYRLIVGKSVDIRIEARMVAR